MEFSERTGMLDLSLRTEPSPIVMALAAATHSIVLVGMMGAGK
jgi:hypothetical protein